MLGLLSEDDATIFQDEETGLIVEQELRQTLAMLNVKEVRLMRHISNVQKIIDAQEKDADFLASSSEENRTGDEFHFDSYSTFKASPLEAMTKLEAELDKVQGRKVKVLAELEKLRLGREKLALEKKRLDGESDQSKLANAWIAALTGEELDEDEEESSGDECDEID